MSRASLVPGPILKSRQPVCPAYTGLTCVAGDGWNRLSVVPDKSNKKEESPASFGNMSDQHWSKARSEMNEEALDYLRDRSTKPGVASGGAARNMYCPSCQGVIPLNYDSREAPTGERENCPHCGVLLDERVREMFNWVEIDQVSGSDAKVILPILLLAMLVVTGLVWWLISMF